jgi:hypothetical protein
MLGVWNAVLCVNAGPFAVTLELQGQKAAQSVTNPPSLKQSAPAVRPVLRAGIDEPLKVRFRVAHTGGTEVQYAVIHLYVAPEEKLNQMPAPNLKSDQIILESALSTRFKTGETVAAQGTLSFRISHPGFYLVRVEGLDIDPAEIEMPYADIDVEVKGDAKE